jgi:hypothetical protein
LVIIDTNLYTKDSYLKGLSKAARQEYHNTLLPLEYRQVDFDKEKVRFYMELWERQLVRGKPIQWGYPIERVEEWDDKGELMVFETPKSMHFIRRQINYWECEPPMYDKKDSLGTFMWFQLILYGIEHKLGILNMGGGVDSWREMIRERDKYPNPKYKWRFIPKWVKDNPDKQPDYFITTNGNYREIHTNLP